MGGSPVIAICGGPEPSTRFRHGYQDVEDVSQFEPVTKSSRFVDTVDRLPDLLRQAFRDATSGGPGPVHLGLRGRIGVVVEDEVESDVLVEPRFAQVPPFRPVAERGCVEEALSVLKQAQRPILVIGGGVVSSGAEPEVLALAERLGIPVATSLNAKHVIPDAHPLAVGVVGSYSRACANKAVAEADVVFFVGSRTGGMVTFNWQIPRKGATVIQLDIDPAELGRNYPNRVSLAGDVQASLRLMLDCLRDAQATAARGAPWRAHTAGLVAQWRSETQAVRHSDAIPMRPERLCAELSDVLPQDAVLVSDTGHAGIWTGTMVELRHAGQRYIRCAGSMGWGLPGAIGVKFALPDRPVVCFTGDGALYYHLPELETAVRHGVKLIVVVNDNAALSQEMPGVVRAYGNQLRGRGTEMFAFEKTDFAEVARSFGCIGLRATTPGEFREAFRAALAADRCVVIDALTDLQAMANKPWA
jgi:acetolactate synthase-1/2/3 large subunit